MADQSGEFLKEVIHLAQYGAEGRSGDVRALARRMAQRYRRSNPELSAGLASVIGQTGSLRSAKRPMPIDADSRMALAKVVDTTFADRPVLPQKALESIDQLIAEHKEPAALRLAGLAPTKSALFVGPPGVGKTMAAGWIAQRLGRPLVVLDLATSISSFLGKTGQNVRQIFDFAKEFECVLLLDEVDAIAKRRADESDLGELKRLVNVLLQELDEWPEGSLVLAATNHPDILDPAIWRRFELTLDFELPSAAERAAVLQRVPALVDNELLAAISAASAGMNHAEIVSAVNAGRRSAILGGFSEGEGIVNAFADRLKKLPTQQRLEVSDRLVKAGLSQRKASELTGASRNTLRKRKEVKQ